MKNNSNINNFDSKAWKWEINDEKCWYKVSDEFLPAALKWKDMGFNKFLDIGCGPGRHSIFMSKLGFDVSALDLSDYAIKELNEKAKQMNLQIKTYIHDMLELPFEDNSFDCVLAFHSIYHTDFNGLKKIVSEIKRVLKPSKEAFITFNSKESDSFIYTKYKIINNCTIIKKGGIEDGIPHTYIDYNDLIELLKGFNILKIQQIFDYYDNKKRAHFFVHIVK